MQKRGSISNNAGAQANIPSWLLEKSTPVPAGRKTSGVHFLARTLKHISEVFENEFVSERFAREALLLQGLDPRVKLLTFLGFIVFAGFSSSIVVLLTLAVIAMLYAGLSGLAVKVFARRTWAYIPAAVFVCSLPGASSLFVKGSPLFYLLKPGFCGLQNGLYFTSAGLGMAFRLALRPGISLAFGFLLLLTTRWNQITGALAALRVPLIFISILNMAYRYIFVMSSMANDMMEARALRTVGKLGAAENRRFMGRSVAHLFIRSHYLSEEIYDAMLCRGFSGKPVSLESFRIKSTDLLFIVNNTIILILLIAGEHLF